MFKRILIANRGEIALRILRCCRELDIETVAVYSEADASALPVIMATHCVCIGPAKASESYLREDVLIETARLMECDAIHPGYGFLSESPSFARKCEEAGITFIGPSADIMEQMGNKQAARERVLAAGVPVVPGSAGVVANAEEAVAVAREIGFPVLLKASAGGGGKGMRRAYSEDEVRSAFDTASKEAAEAFGNGEMYLEKLIASPRHIEFQILGDRFGTVVQLGERDCSLQRRNQKFLEESPSHSLSEELRGEMGEMAVRAAKAVGYYNAGTVEFIVDGEGNYYFIEMNTRIQVEHPVTELLTGVDLIKEQLRIAAGGRISETLGEKACGHAMECRINAQTPGVVSFVHFPAGYGVRVDSHLYNGCEVSPYYDSMLAKIIVRGGTRLEAIRRMRRALEELVIEGVETNAEFMHLLVYHPEFIKGNYTTDFWERNHETIERWQREGVGSHGRK